MFKKIWAISIIATLGFASATTNYGMNEQNIEKWKNEAQNNFGHLRIDEKNIGKDKYNDFSKNVEEGGIFADKLKALENNQNDDGFLTAQERIKIIE